MSHSGRELLWAEACDLTSPDEHAAVARHLAECPSCQDEFAFFSVEREILEEATRRKPPVWRAPWILTAAAVLIFALTGIAILRSGVPRPRGIEDTGGAPLKNSNQPSPQREGAAIALPGNLEAFRGVEIYAKVQAYVERLNVDRGSQVKVGQVLAQLKAPELKAQCDEARAQLVQEEHTLQRLKAIKAIEPSAITDEDLATAQGKTDIALARLKTCEANFAYLEITAPFDGVIIERGVNLGSMVGPPTGDAFKPLFRLQEVGRLHLVVEIPESEVTSVVMTKGHHVKFRVDALPGQSFTGTVGRPAVLLNPNTRCMAAELDVDNASGSLLPGMRAQVEWPRRQ